MLEDFVIFLAGVDNENEKTGKKQQDEWEEEMVDLEKFKAWQEKHTIKPTKRTKKISKKIVLKND